MAEPEVLSGGTVEWFDDKLGSGLVRTADGRLIYVHYKDVARGGHRSLHQGDTIDLRIRKMPEGLRATVSQPSRNVAPDVYCRTHLGASFVRFMLKRGSVRYMWTVYNGYVLVNMVRYYLLRTRHCEIYIHQFLSDDEHVLHDHPWSFLTLILAGGYVEEIADGTTLRHRPGALVYRRAGHAHRVMIPDRQRGRVWTLVVTGRRRAAWSFFDRSRATRVTPYEYGARRGAEMRIDADFEMEGTLLPVLKGGTRPPTLLQGIDASA